MSGILDSNYLSLLLFGCLTTALLFNLDYRDYDETYYTNAIDRMIETGDLLIPRYHDGSNRINKPPLIYWTFLTGRLLTGHWIYGIRLMSWVAALFTVLMIGRMEKRLLDNVNPGISSYILISTPIFIQYSIFGIPEMIFTFFITWAHFEYFLLLSDENRAKTRLYLILAAGFLIKGPGIVVFILLTCLGMCLATKATKPIKALIDPLGIILFLMISSSWYIYLLIKFGSDELIGMFNIEIVNRLIENSGTWVRRVEIIQKLSPWAFLFFIPGIWRRDEETSLLYLKVWLISSLLFLVLAIRTFHIHYALTLVVPAVLIVANFLSKNPGKRWILLLPLVIWWFTLALEYLFFNKILINGQFRLVIICLLAVLIVASFYFIKDGFPSNSIKIFSISFLFLTVLFYAVPHQDIDLAGKAFQSLQQSNEPHKIYAPDPTIYNNILFFKPAFRQKHQVIRDMAQSDPTQYPAKVLIIEEGENKNHLRKTERIDSAYFHRGKSVSKQGVIYQELNRFITGSPRWHLYYILQSKN